MRKVVIDRILGVYIYAERCVEVGVAGNGCVIRIADECGSWNIDKCLLKSGGSDFDCEFLAFRGKKCAFYSRWD